MEPSGRSLVSLNSAAADTSAPEFSSCTLLMRSMTAVSRSLPSGSLAISSAGWNLAVVVPRPVPLCCPSPPVPPRTKASVFSWASFTKEMSRISWLGAMPFISIVSTELDTILLFLSSVSSKRAISRPPLRTPPMMVLPCFSFTITWLCATCSTSMVGLSSRIFWAESEPFSSSNSANMPIWAETMIMSA
ncbi:hypothetical protein SDC9_144403 [bioreactor metagenome]|uniref:Uncharacterized protein n=1 Tax=bioreactor metagenome TaxID=1076179 RepID=A0A645E614_9ZZZZ